MLFNAAQFGMDNICIMAKELLGGKISPGDLNTMLHDAAAAGNLSTCRLARKWGAMHYGGMLIAAAAQGNIKMCKLAQKWGARNYSDMEMVGKDHFPDVIRLMKRWLRK